MNIFRTPVPVWAGENDAGGGDGADAGDKKVDEGAGGDQGGTGDKGAGDDKGDDKAAGDQGDKGGSFLDGADGLDDKGDKNVPADWPADWRDKLAGTDEKLKTRLARMKAPTDLLQAWRQAEAKITSGKTVSDEPMPDPEKEPEKAKEWRKARGIPDDPTGYAVPDTVKALVTDADKPRLAEFTEHMHKSNVPASAAAAALEYYFQADAAAKEAIAIADRADQEETQEVLRGEWGPEFKANATLAKRFAEEVTPGVNWFNARLPDGRVLGNIPDFVKSLADMARDKYGDVSFAGAEASQRTTARKEEIERMQREEPDKYEGDPKIRKEYQDIVEAELKAAGRNERNHSAKQ